MIDCIYTILNNKYKLREISENTLNRYMDSVKIIASYFGDTYISAITYEEIVDFFYKITEKYSQSMVHKIYVLLRMVFKYAYNNQIIKTNILSNLKEPRSMIRNKEVIALTLYEHRHLVEVLTCFEINNIYADIILLQLYSGMRIGEVLALNKEDVQGHDININKTLTKDLNNKIIVGVRAKTYSSTRKISKNIVLDSVINHAVLHSSKKSALLFNKDGKLITTYAVNSYLKRINIKYNISKRLTTHMLRHTYATRCIESGMSAVVLARKLGHKDVKMTLNVYSSVFDKFVDTQDTEYIQYLKNNSLL